MLPRVLHLFECVPARAYLRQAGRAHAAMDPRTGDDPLCAQLGGRATNLSPVLARIASARRPPSHVASSVAWHVGDDADRDRGGLSVHGDRLRTTIAVSLGIVLAMLAITVIAALGSPKFACGDMSGLPISLVVPKEDRISSALTEHRRRALLPEPSRRRALRRRVGLSQGVIAEALGVSPPTASRYEAGISTPKGEVLASYLQILALLETEGDDLSNVHDAAGQAAPGGWRTEPAMNQSSGATEAGLYLAALFEGAPAGTLIEVRCPKREPKIQQFFPVREIEAAATFVAGWARATDVYVGVAPRMPTKGKRRGGKDASHLFNLSG